MSLSRPSDLELVPALVEQDFCEEPWTAIERWAAPRPGAEVEDRIRLLGLPGGVVGRAPTTRRSGVITTHLGERRNSATSPVVLNLSSLWAGPLAGRLLAGRGATVVNVESCQRPDGLRSGSPEFFRALRSGQRSVQLDLKREVGVLVALIESADLVIEGSRPRALEHLGIDAAAQVERGTSWLSITAQGRGSDAVGFGDDVAACAGMVRWVDGAPRPVGDAIADPLTGLAAAAAGAAALSSAEARLIDVSMVDVVRETTGPIPDHVVVRRGGAWFVETENGRVAVAEPFHG